MEAAVGKSLDQIMVDAIFEQPGEAEEGVIYTLANGDLRDSANKTCWPEQAKMEAELTAVIQSIEYAPGKKYRVERLHGFDPELGHGFINSQAMGNDVLRKLPKNAKVILAESVWQYSHHVVGALAEQVRENGAQLLTLANYSGTWPGLVGMSNDNASLVKRGLKLGEDFSTTWSENFDSREFRGRMESWLTAGKIKLDASHIKYYDDGMVSSLVSDYGFSMEVGGRMARKLKHERAIMGGLDFYCMGMDNAFFSPEKLSPMGIGHEFLSQSDLVAKMGLIADPDGIKASLLGYKNSISDNEAWGVIQWCIDKGMQFDYVDVDMTLRTERLEAEKTKLTKRQLIEQGKMYIAAVRIADKFDLDVIGIQYQQGLKDCCAASDLVEGLLNNAERPDVLDEEGRVIRKGEAIPCFNEVDQGCGVDLILSKRIWKAFGEDATANQEDVRWSRKYSGKATYQGKEIQLDNEEVWVDLLSGSAPANHLKGGYSGAKGMRQPPMYFPLGGSTLAGEGKSGEVVISRVYQDADGNMCMNLMRGGVVELPEEETQDRLDKTTPQWPIKHLVRYGVNRDQMLLHPSNHETILYASSAEMANKLMFAKAQMAKELGMKVQIWGEYDTKYSLEEKAKAA